MMAIWRFLFGAVFVVQVGVLQAGILYVDINSTNPVPPYAAWNTAAVAIQDAVDAASAGDEIVVSNGIYRVGGKCVYPSDRRGNLTNRVALDKAVVVRSVNGPEVTVIEGNSPIGPAAVRCVYMTNDATLVGFTITNGATFTMFGNSLNQTERAQLASGGGIWCEDASATISNCVIVANSAEYGYGGLGGGVYGGTVESSTLANNQAVAGGGAYGSILLECTLTNNRATTSPYLTSFEAINTYGGGANGCSLTNCTLAANVSDTFGGGVASSTLFNCVVRDNRAFLGGGASYGGVLNCLLSGNSARGEGGGCYSASATNCTFEQNSAAKGGGARLGTLNNCILSGNLALDSGGGAEALVINNSAVLNNSAVTNGGGVSACVLNNCTLLGNSAPKGGGCADSTLTNCIAYYNVADAGANHTNCVMDHCCTLPLPAGGEGNTDAEPRFSDSTHLSADSPCVGAGNPIAATGTDIDGDSWGTAPSIGCDEYSATAEGDLNLAIQSDYANANPGFELHFVGSIAGQATGFWWDFGDGSQTTNTAYAAHGWTAEGDYTVTLTAYNASHPLGVQTNVIVRVRSQPVQYVDQDSADPEPPFTSWATAATNIQDAVDAAFGGGSRIVVSNGVYQTGGRVVTGVLTNRIAITKPIIVESVNGPDVTIIRGAVVSGGVNGDSAVRCAYLADGATLNGFTLAGGATRTGYNSYTQVEQSGGGIWCQSAKATVTNCVIEANSCYWWGAGACSGTLENCELNDNTNLNGSLGGGGGAAFATLRSCNVTANRTFPGDGGGAIFSLLSNCVVSGNDDGGVKNCTLDACVVSANLGTGVINGTADNSTICSNRASQGSMIGDSPGGGAYNATLNHCVVCGNTATNGGGAYNCTLNSCILSNNWASLDGGGAYCRFGIYSTYTNAPGTSNIFDGNSAGRTGGGLYSWFTYTNFNFSSWEFSSNSAGTDGGGVSVNSSSCSFSDCTFTGNSSGGNGGGLAGYEGISVVTRCSNCVFSGNVAAADGGGAWTADLTDCDVWRNHANNGGGVYGTATQSRFAGNIATGNGGGILLFKPSFSLTPYSECLFETNRAGSGGAVFFQSQDLAFSNSVFSSNEALTNGGGVCGSIGNFTLKDCLFTGNTAAFGGGGFNGGYSNCMFEGNTAMDTGGAVYCLGFGPGIGLLDCVLWNNSATNNGGAAAAGLGRCVLFDNWAGGNGGAVYNSSVDDCIISNNWAGINGGGAYNSSLNTCLLTGNAAVNGGGLYGGSSIQNCTIVKNKASDSGGGVYFIASGNIASCIVYYNSATNDPDFHGYAGPRFSCCQQLPPGPPPTGTITNEPLFVDLNGGNFRLQSNSPCIDSGLSYIAPIDLDGRHRPMGYRVDMGAYEFQGAGMGEFIQWLQDHNLPTDGSADQLDSDGDLMNNWGEWRSKTDPTNDLSVLKMMAPTTDQSGTFLSWESSTNVAYFVSRSGNLGWSNSFEVVGSNIIGQSTVTGWTDTNAAGGGSFFYRVGVQ